MASEAGFPPRIPPEHPSLSQPDLKRASEQPDLKRAPEVPIPSPFPAFPTALPLTTTHTVAAIPISKEPTSRLRRLISWVRQLFAQCFGSKPKLSFNAAKLTSSAVSIYQDLKKEEMDKRAALPEQVHIAVYSPKGSKVEYSSFSGRDLKAKDEEEAQFFSDLDDQMRQLGKDPDMPENFQGAVQDRRYDVSPPWRHHVAHLHGANEDAAQEKYINQYFVDNSPPGLQYFVDKSLEGFKVRPAQSPHFSAKDISVHIENDKVESRCVRLYEVVDRFTNTVKGHIVSVSAKTIPLQLLCKPWDRINPKECAGCTHKIEYTSLIKDEAAALRKFERLSVESELARADTHAQTRGLAPAIRAAMPDVFKKLPTKAAPIEMDPHNPYADNLFRDIRCRVFDSEPAPYVQPKSPPPTRTDEPLKKVWANKMQQDIHDRIVKKPGDEQWVPVILNLQNPSYFMRPMQRTATDLIQKQIKEHFVDQLGETRGEKEARKYSADGTFPFIDFKLNRDPVTGQITHLDYTVKDITLDLKKNEPGIDRTTGMPARTVVIPGILKGTFSGIVHLDKEKGFVLSNIKMHRESPFRYQSLIERVSTPFESDTSRKVRTVVSPLDARSIARGAIPPRAITATPTTAEASRVTSSVRFASPNIGPAEPVQPVPIPEPGRFVPKAQLTTPSAPTPAATSASRPLAPAPSSSSRAPAASTSRPTQTEATEKMPATLVKELNAYKKNVTFRLPHVLRNQLESTPKETVEEVAKREAEGKGRQEGLRRIVDKRGDRGERERYLLTPSSVFGDVDRMIRNPLATHFKVKTRLGTVPLASVPGSGTPEAIHDFYYGVKRIMPARTLSQLEPNPTENPTWFNNLMFVHSQSGWRDENADITHEFERRNGIVVSATALKAEDTEQPRNRKKLSRDTVIEFDEETGNVTTRSTVIFKVIIPPYTGKGQPRYMVRTVERTFPISALASGTFKPEDLAHAQYAVHSSSLLTSENAAFAEMEKRTKANYQFPVDLIKESRENYDIQMKKMQKMLVSARDAGNETITKLLKEESYSSVRAKEFQENIAEALADKTSEYGYKFEMDTDRAVNFEISGGYQREVTPANKTHVATESARIQAMLKPEEIVPWKKVIESIINQGVIRSYTNEIIAKMKIAVLSVSEFNMIQIKMKEFIKPTSRLPLFAPIKIKINRSPEPDGAISSVEFSFKGEVDILTPDGASILRDSCFKCFSRGTITLEEGVPKVDLRLYALSEAEI